MVVTLADSMKQTNYKFILLFLAVSVFIHFILNITIILCCRNMCHGKSMNEGTRVFAIYFHLNSCVNW